MSNSNSFSTEARIVGTMPWVFRQACPSEQVIR